MRKKIGEIIDYDVDACVEMLKSMTVDEKLGKFWRCENGLYPLQKEGDSSFIMDNYEYDARNLKECMNYFKMMNKGLEILFTNELFVLVTIKNKKMFVLKEFAKIKYAKNYDGLTLVQLHQESGIPLEKNQLINCDDSIVNIDSDIKTIELNVSDKKKELENKIKELEKSYRIEIEQLEKETSRLKDKIFYLRLNIFELRTSFGDTFDLYNISKGKNTEIEIPLIIYQKFRYLDEEFSLLQNAHPYLSLDQTTIMSFFNQGNNLIIDTFIPTEKGIVCFKVSEDNKRYFKDKNILETLENYHKDQIGLLLKNGENVYLAFIDNELIVNNNIFVTEKTMDENIVKIENIKSIRDKQLNEVINRKLLLSIIKKLTINSNIFPGLEQEDLLNSNKIVFSSADNFIQNNTYKTFSEYLNSKKCCKRNETIYIFDEINGSVDHYNSFNGNKTTEHRSRSYFNRVKDADLEKGITKLNLIEKNEYYGVYYYFVSCAKRNSEKNSRANIQVYSDEFISIEYINEFVVSEWIINKNCHGKNFLYFLKAFQEIKKFVSSRDKRFFEKLNIEYNVTNVNLFHEWRKNNNVLEMTSYQIKRFENSIKN